MLFRDREEAGTVLARKLMAYEGHPDLLVLALPRGGVPVAEQVALALGAPLDVFVVRKLGVPGQEELALGALASGEVRVLNDDVIELLGIDEASIDAITELERRELERQERTYRDGRPAHDAGGKVVILVDDGIATGASMLAALAALRLRRPRSIVVATPVAASEACAELETLADDVVCAMTPVPFYGVGQWYRDFRQTSDEEVRAILRNAMSAEQPSAS
jgi:predicted phosphoribosyltransferase